MTLASLLVSQEPPVPSPPAWFDVVGMPGGVMGGLDTPAFYYNGNTYIGYMDPRGNIRVASYNHTTHAVTISPAIVTGLNSNWHLAPAVLVRSSDHKLVIAVPDVSAFYIAISTNAEDVSAWGAATDISATLGGSTYIFANLFQLSGESGTIYLCYANQPTSPSVNYSCCYSTSTDGGSTWAAQTKVYSTGNTNHPEFAFSSDMNSRIDFLVADGQASADSSASLYHFYYTGGSFLKSDGTAVGGSKPYAPSGVTKIYDGATNGLVRSPTTIVTNGGSPVASWVAFNSAGSGSNENYWYGTCSAGTWTVNTITDSGAVIEVPGAAEGGTANDPTDPTVVYVSKKTSGRWQMFEYQTANGGTTWSSTQLTSDTTDSSLAGDVKPVCPTNAVSTLRCLWNSGPYGPQSLGASTNIGATMKIRGYPNPL